VRGRPSLAARLAARAASGLDRAVTLAVRVSSAGADGDATALSHETRLRAIEVLLERYAELDTHAFFPAPRAIEPLLTERGRHGELTRFDLGWPSVEHTFLPELEAGFRHTVENRTAVARLFARSTPRPVAILLHGYILGQLSLEERLWPLRRFDALGIDSALLVLPFHGVRADPRRSGRPEFPGRDPAFGNEGFRQAITDLRELADFLRRRGHPAVGVMGTSLGGYSAALAATVEARLDFVVPIVPLASLADFALEQGELPDAPEPRAREHALIEAAYRLVSPVHRPPLVASERVLVLGAKADRITPFSHARRLSSHFRAPLVALSGSHLLQLGRASAFERVFELLGRLGLAARSG